MGHDTWRAAGIVLTIEPLLPARAPPWEVAACPHVTFSLDIGALRRDAPPDELYQAAQRHLASLPQQAIWVWTDGSADAGVRSGGAGAFVEWPDGATDELRVPAGQLCSSFRAEMVTLRAALNHLRDHPHQPSAPITICSDSQSALATLREGPASQKTLLGAAIWTELAALAGPSRRIHLQWVPSHCGVDENERADQIAKEATALPQAAVPVDVATAHRAAARLARDRTIAAWPEGWYRTLMENRLPPPAATGDRSSAVEVHQLRAGHWSGSRQYLHRIGRNPSDDRRQCPDTDCAAGRCTVCREEADTPRHFFFRCPALMGWCLRRYGTIFPNPEDIRDDGEVAALVKRLQR